MVFFFFAVSLNTFPTKTLAQVGRVSPLSGLLQFTGQGHTGALFYCALGSPWPRREAGDRTARSGRSREMGVVCPGKGFRRAARPLREVAEAAPGAADLWRNEGRSQSCAGSPRRSERLSEALREGGGALSAVWWNFPKIALATAYCSWRGRRGGSGGEGFGSGGGLSKKAGGGAQAS